MSPVWSPCGAQLGPKVAVALVTMLELQVGPKVGFVGQNWRQVELLLGLCWIETEIVDAVVPMGRLPAEAVPVNRGLF